MEDREYIINEARIVYKYSIKDEYKIGDKKKLYSAMLKIITGTINCDIGGIEYLLISKEEIKNIIKYVVEEEEREAMA